MKEDSIVQKKSYLFAIRIVKLFQYLTKENKFHPLEQQILRSGTSIGANLEEASGGYSKKDFLSKLSIAYREARETRYWLKILKDTNYLNEKIFTSLFEDCEELLRIISKIQITTKANLKQL